MAHSTYNLFLISYSIKPNLKRPIHTFFCDSYEKAKIYFHDYIKNAENKIGYTLYKIAEINKELKLTETKIFICGGYEITYKPVYKKDILTEKIRIEKASKAKEIKEQLKILFDGKDIDVKKRMFGDDSGMALSQ